MIVEIGDDEGATCNRDFNDGEGPCPGTMEFNVDNCSCHISPPCGACLNGLECNECGTRSGPDGDTSRKEWDAKARGY